MSGAGDNPSRNDPSRRSVLGPAAPMEFNPTYFCVKLVHEMSDAVIYSDAEGRIQFWNRGAERIFGHVEREVLGQSLDIIIPENLRR